VLIYAMLIVLLGQKSVRNVALAVGFHQLRNSFSRNSSDNTAVDTAASSTNATT
jgi:hypothetical protein